MEVKLLPHNQRTFNEVQACIKQGKNCCVVNDCGTGKSSIMAAIIAQNPMETFLVVVSQKNAKQYLRDMSDCFKQSNVQIITYAKLVKDYINGQLHQYNQTMFLLDEAHSVGAPKTSEAILWLSKQYHPRLIGFTATPQRYADQGTDVTVVTKYFGGNAVGNVTAKSLAKQGVMVEPDYYLSLWDLETQIQDKIAQVYDADLPEETQQKYITQLTHVLDQWKQESNPEKVLAEVLPQYMHRKTNRILVYVANTEDLTTKRVLTKYVQRAFPGKTVKDYVYTYRHSESVFMDFQQDDDTDIKILYSINKVMETIHMDDVRIVIFLRPSVSKRIITQQAGRLNSLKNFDKAVIIDMVDNMIQLQPKEIHEYSKYGQGQQSFYVKHVDRYFRIFDILTIPQYTYQGFTGTLSDICYVYCRDIQKVKELLQHTVLEEAMEQTEMVYKAQYMEPSFDMDFTLSEESQKLANKYLHYWQNFIKRRITDEDLRSILYCQYLKGISVAQTTNTPTVVAVHHHMKMAYLKYCRAQVVKNQLCCSISTIKNTPTADIEKFEYEERNRIINQILDKSEEDGVKYREADKDKKRANVAAIESSIAIFKRNMAIFREYYGFTGEAPVTGKILGEKYGLSSGRVLQIINQTLYLIKRYFFHYNRRDIIDYLSDYM